MGNFIIFVILSLFLRRILGHLFHFSSPHHFFLSFSRTFFSFPFFFFAVAIFSFLLPRLFLAFIGTIIFISPLLRSLAATTKPAAASIETSRVEFWFQELGSMEICELRIWVVRKEMDYWFESWDPRAFKDLDDYEQKRKETGFLRSNIRTSGYE